MRRRDAISVLTAVGLFAGFAVSAETAVAQDMPGSPEEAGKAAESDMVMGEPDAPITIIAYESLTCPHCASFHTDTLPELKKQYIDTGKAKFVFRDFPFDGAALRAAMLVRCAEPDRRFGFLGVLFRTQDNWARAEDPVSELAKVARMGGMSQERFDQCLADESVMNGVLERRLVGNKVFEVQSTPTFIINGGEERVIGAQSFEEFDKVLKPLLE